jgi:branched-chain amino acid transport system ATP-binding protein
MRRTFEITATFASMTVRENVQVTLLAHRRRVCRLMRPAAAPFAVEADSLLEQVGMRAQGPRAAGVPMAT